ncbi:hypothetical protein FRC08_013744 [Ceratobasidium sp. 394]|nr:hypothetical protein FRC08_013744 [Ceratobasidium sp. 394]KAG9083380.1 hypothetical protein FS749_006069 [Ceratobasidium sp. UAMH 11750]
MAQQQQKAALLLSKQGKVEVGTRPVPIPQDKEALVKVTAAAINPVDWIIVDHGIFITEFPAVLGIDAAGVVESAGPEVTDFKTGDRVVFQGRIAPSDMATFQQYVLADTEAMAKTPSNITDDQASTIPLGSITALYGLFQKSGIAFPGAGLTAVGKSIFIFRGSSSVGQFAIQLARIAGFTTISTTASAQHTDFLKSLGATHIFDRDTDLKTIQSTLSLPFDRVFDIIGDLATQSFAIDLLMTPFATPGAHLGTIRPLDESLKDKAEGITVHSVFGSSHGGRELSVPYWQVLAQWLKEGTLVPNRVQVVEGGLSGVTEAFDLSRKGVSGVKLVVHPQE